MQKINSFKNIQKLGNKSEQTSAPSTENALKALEQGVFGPQGQAQNEFKNELSKNMDLSLLANPKTKTQNPELAQLLNTQINPEQARVNLDQARVNLESVGVNLESVGVNPEQSEVNLEQSGVNLEQSKIVTNLKPKSIFINNKSNEAVIDPETGMPQELTLDAVNTDKPRSIFGRRSLPSDVETPKVQKGAQGFVHKSVLKVAQPKTAFGNPQAQAMSSAPVVNESENLINLRNMMNKSNHKTLNGSQFNKTAATDNGLINLNAVTEKDDSGQDSSFNSSDQSNDLMPNQFTQKSESAQGESKVFNMSGLDKIDTSNTEQVIEKISDYIAQSKIESSKSVEMTVMDKNLGKIDLIVQKSADNSLNIVLNASNSEATLLLNQNKSDLISSLSKSGFTVNDVKVDLSNAKSNSGSEFSQNSSSNQNQNQQFGSKQNEQNEQSQKRSELWDLLRDKEAA